MKSNGWTPSPPHLFSLAAQRTGCSSVPDRGFLGPARGLIPIPERFGGLFQEFVVVGRLVGRHTGPVQRLGRSIGAWEFLDDLAEASLGLIPFFLRERDLGATEHQL